MKRCFSIAMVFVLIALLGCQRKKERLSAPTTTLQISPSVARLAANAQKTFTATLRSPQGENLDVSGVTWKLSSDTLGQILPDTGEQTTFFAGQALGVSGTLQATVNGMTATAQIAVGSATGDPATSYGFFTESLPNGMKLDIANPSDPDGGFLGAGGGTGGSTLLETVTDPSLVTEGSKSLKATISGTPASFAFFYFSYGYPDAANISRDLSAFSGGSVKFDIKAPANQTVKLKLEWKTSQNFSVPINNYIVFDNQFHSVSIPLSAFTGLDLSQFETVTFAFDPGDVNGTFSFYIDNLRFER